MIQQVVAGVIVEAGRVLVAQRQHGAMAGKWEFPGGKVEAGETLEEALARELREEFDVTVVVGERIDEQIFFSNGQILRLIAFYVQHLRGAFIPVDHRKILWLPPEALPTVDFTTPDIPMALKVLDHFQNGDGAWRGTLRNR